MSQDKTPKKPPPVKERKMLRHSSARRSDVKASEKT